MRSRFPDRSGPAGGSSARRSFSVAASRARIRRFVREGRPGSARSTRRSPTGSSSNGPRGRAPRAGCFRCRRVWRRIASCVSAPSPAPANRIASAEQRAWQDVRLSTCRRRLSRRVRWHAGDAPPPRQPFRCEGLRMQVCYDKCRGGPGKSEPAETERSLGLPSPDVLVPGREFVAPHLLPLMRRRGLPRRREPVASRSGAVGRAGPRRRGGLPGVRADAVSADRVRFAPRGSGGADGPEFGLVPVRDGGGIADSRRALGPRSSVFLS